MVQDKQNPTGGRLKETLTRVADEAICYDRSQVSEVDHGPSDARIHELFRLRSLMSCAGTTLPLPVLRIIDDEPPVVPVEPPHHAGEMAGAPAWASMIEPGMTLAQIQSIIREHGTADEIRQLDESLNNPNRKQG